MVALHFAPHSAPSRPFRPWTAFLTFTLLGLTGCTAVHVASPMGVTPAKLKPARWPGIWVNETHTLRVAVSDAEGGTLQVTIPEERGRTEPRTFTVVVRECCSTLFASVR